MKHLLLWAVLLLPDFVFAEVTLIGPATAEVGKPVDIEVDGLPNFDVDKTLKELFTWTDQVRLKVSQPVEGRAKLNSTVGFDLIDKQFRLTVSFTPYKNGVYVVQLANTLNGQLEITDHRIEVGGTPDPGPGPTPPGPIPDDKFDNVGKLSFALVSQLTPAAKAKSKSVAALYDVACEKLESGEFVNVTAAANWLQAERKKLITDEWNSVILKLGEVWTKHWPLDKEGVIQFYRAVSAGLKGI